MACAKCNPPIGSTARTRAGSHGGAAASESAGRVDRIFGAILNFGDHAVEYNFGELLPGSIAGRVHADEHEDCNFDDPEILLEGVRIDLLDGDGNFLRSTLTDAKGEYRFTGLGPGIYQVREHQPTQYYDGGERIGTAGGAKHDVPGVYSIFTGINITSGLDAIQYDFCEKVGVMLSGNVYHDRDNDGVFDRGPEEGIAGVVVKLLDGSGNDTGLRATTDSAGFYKFNNLAAGKYAVMEIHPSGWLDGIDTPGNLGGVAAVSPPGDMISQIMINWGEMGTEYNFGELLPGSIAGRVHADEHEDCNFDEPEILLEGVRIDLLDGDGNVLATTLTDADGEYRFTGLRPGILQRSRASADAVLRRRRADRHGRRREARRAGRVQHLHGHQHHVGIGCHPVRLLREGRRNAVRQCVPRPRQRRHLRSWSGGGHCGCCGETARRQRQRHGLARQRIRPAFTNSTTWRPANTR